MMLNTRIIEIMVGVFVAAGFAALFMLAMQVSNLSDLETGGGYRLYANFENIGGLKVRSAVTMSGVKVGRVSAIDYDRDRFQARVELTIDERYDYLPFDTQASIYTAGLLGEQYIALAPGGAPEVLGDGDTLTFTQSALVLEELIGQFLVNVASGE
jgi:phospholipid/cholesterol/gamma-HCH transport system substrate-binding protein